MYKIIIFLFIMLFFSCDEIITLKNEPKDINDADKQVVLFYENLSKKDISNIYKLCDKSLNKNEIESIVLTRDSILGKINNVDIVKIETEYYEKNNVSKTTYKIITDVNYENGKQLEKLIFLKIESNPILLKVYEIYDNQPLDNYGFTK